MKHFFQRLAHGWIIIVLLTGLFAALQVNTVWSNGTISLPAQVNTEFVPNSIPSGGKSTLSITIFNPNPFALSLSTAPAALTDSLPAGVTFADPVNVTNTCGGTVNTTGTTLTLIGGSVPAKVGLVFGSCTITVDVTSIVATTHINTIPAENLKATDPTGTISVTNTTPASNNLLVTALQPPSLSKGFTPNTLYVGQTSQLSITIRNNDLNYSLTNVSVTDNLPANVVIANSTVTSNGCGTPTVNVAANDTSVTISNATIAKNAVCVVSVNVTSSVADVYLNTIPANAITSQQHVTNGSLASAPINFQSIGATKVFSPTSFQVGGISTMTITLQNPTLSPYTGVSFTDNLPAGMTISGTPSASQCGGTVTYTSGSISLSGGIVPGGTSYANPGKCTVIADVTSSIASAYTNSIAAGNIKTDQGATNVSAVTANLSVYASGGGITSPTKTFTPSTIAVGGISRLAINVRAPADINLTGFVLTDALPIGVQVAAVPNATKNTNCQGGSFAPAAGSTLLTYTGGTIPKGQQCTLSVDVITTAAGTFVNTISPANISNNEGRNISSSFSATLRSSGIGVTKAFYPAMVNINGISTLSIVLTNTNDSYLEDVDLLDPLPTGTNIAAESNLSNTCGGTVNLDTVNRRITLVDGVVPARVGTVNGICTINVDVVGLTTGAKNNQIAIGAVTGIISGNDVAISNPAAANATLTVSSISINVVKGFSPIQVFGGSSSRLTVTLTNPTTTQLVGIGFTDQLPQGTGGGMSIANPPQPSVGTCGGTLTAAAGGTSFTYADGYLPPNSSCSISVNVTMNVEANLTNIIPVGAVTTSNGATNALTAEASLTNLPGASVSKVFVDNTIMGGESTALKITIQNQSNFPLTGLGLVDVLPSGVTQTGTLEPSQCNGTLAYDSGTRTISFSGGSLEAFDSCTLQLEVTAASVGVYQNCIEANVLVNDQDATNEKACDTLTVEQALNPPVISKNFAPNPVATNVTSALTFTITNSNAVALTGVNFTDTFPTGLVVSSPPNPTQCGGTVTTTTNSITLSGGTISANGSCTVTVGTKATVGGNYANVSGAVASTNGGTGNTASRTLTVIAPPVISKSFSPNTITRGDVSTLTFEISNPLENTVSLTGVNFMDALPTGVEVAVDPNVQISAQCGIASFAPAAGDTTLSFSGGTIAIAPNNTCVVSVDVTAPNGGVYLNTSGAVKSTNGGTGNTAEATLTAQGVGLSLVKTSLDENFKAEGDVITYQYLLTNTGTAPLYAPFTVTDDKVGSVDCGNGGTVLVLNAGESTTCTATYTILGEDVTAKQVTNIATAQAKDAETDGDDVTSNSSTVTVLMAKLTLRKTTPTLGYRAAGDRIEYTYTLTNTGNVTLYAPFEVSDDHFGSGTPFACGSATILPPGAVTSCAKSGTSRYTVTTGDVTAGLVANIAYATAVDQPTDGEIVTSNTDSVTVYKLVGPVISKEFSPDPIAVGTTTTLTFTITNPNTTVSLTGVGFVDNFPAGVTRVTDPAAAQCGGAVTSTATSITLTGGAIIPDGSCTVSILVTAAQPGNYVNTSGTVTSTNGGNGNTASDTLTVVSPPVIQKAFSPVSILENGTSTLTLTITNPTGNTVALTGVGFVDNFPTGLTVQDPPNLNLVGCGTPGITVNAGDTSLNFSGGTLAAGGTCTVSVDVTAGYGVYDNSTLAVTSTNGGTGVKSNTATLSVNQAVDLSITKDDGKADVEPGEESTYVVEVYNAGPSAAVGATVYDTFPSSLTDVSWTCTADTGASCTSSGSGKIQDTVTIPAGTKVVYTIPATVDEAASTSIINTASVVPPVGMVDLDETNNSARDTDYLNLLSITKNATQTSVDTLNGTVDYTYTITNTGTSTLLAPFNVSDDKTTVVCSSVPVSLAPAEFFTCSSAYTVTQTDLDDGTITNTASATGYDSEGDLVASNVATQTVTADQNPSISLAKTGTLNLGGNGRVDVGDTITYTFTVTNTGNVTLTDVDVTDTVGGVTISGAAIDSLAPGGIDTDTFTGSYTLTQDDVDAGAFTNTATASGNPPVGDAVTGTDDDSQTLPVAAGVVLEKTGAVDDGGDGRVDAGDVINYTFTVTNTGNVTLTDLVVSEISGGISLTGSTIDSLAPGDSNTTAFSGSYALTQADVDMGSFTNEASVTGSLPQGGTVSDTDDDSQTFIPQPSVKLEKTGVLDEGDNGRADAGDTIDYTFTVTNTGNVTLKDLVVSEVLGGITLTGSSIGSLAPGESNDTSYTGSYTLTQEDVDSGSFTNTASVIGYPPVGDAVTDSDDDTQELTPEPTIELVKVGTVHMDVVEPDDQADPGDEITYTFTVTNTGNVTLKNVDITEDVAGVSVSGDAIDSLAPGASNTDNFTGSYTLSQADVDAGSFLNTATVQGTPPEGDAVTDSTEDTRTLSTAAAPGIAKRLASLPVEVSPGVWEVVFEILVRNYGNVTLSDVQVTDDLEAAFPGALVVVQSVDSSDFSVNPSYDGLLDINLLDGSDSLAFQEEGTITLTVHVTPIDDGLYNNTAVVSAQPPSGDSVEDDSQNSADPDPDEDFDPANNNDPTPVNFGPNMFDPPFGIKVFDDDGLPLLHWTMIWINTTNVVNITASVSDPIPVGSTFEAVGVASGTGVPSTAPSLSTDVGIRCSVELTSQTTTTWCYYEGPTLEYPRGRIVWEGSLGPDLDVTDPTLAENALTIEFDLRVNNGVHEVNNEAVIGVDRDGDGVVSGENEESVAVAAETWANWPTALPDTGFAPGKITDLSTEPVVEYASMSGMSLEIPALNISAPIVGVPIQHGTWNLDWLNGSVGYLENTAYPTWEGNSALTAHNYDANGNPGLFADLGTLRWGDRVVIHAWGEDYVYEVRTVRNWVDPENTNAITHEEYSWLTLITCRGYDEESDSYRWRTVVRAVLVGID